MTLRYTEVPSIIEVVETGELVLVDNKNPIYIALLQSHGDPPAPYTHLPLTDEQKVQIQFPESGSLRVLFEALFEIANRLQALEGKQPITRIQLRNWLISKFPPPEPQTQPPFPP